MSSNDLCVCTILSRYSNLTVAESLCIAARSRIRAGPLSTREFALHPQVGNADRAWQKQGQDGAVILPDGHRVIPKFERFNMVDDSAKANEPVEGLERAVKAIVI